MAITYVAITMMEQANRVVTVYKHMGDCPMGRSEKRLIDDRGSESSSVFGRGPRRVAAGPKVSMI